MMKLHTDGACIVAEGKMGIGFVLETPDGSKHMKSVRVKDKGTNNIAEYTALIEGLKYALSYVKEYGTDNIIHIYSDSQLMVNQVLGNYRIKNNNLRLLHRKVLELLDNFIWKIEWIPREYNTEADELSKEATQSATTVA